MMRKTHRAFSGVFWLSSTLAVNELAQHAGFEAPFHPVVITAGFFIAPWFSAGRWLSPDMDHRWAPGPPRKHYDWRYHRGFTHRVWFASLLSMLSVILLYLPAINAGVPAILANGLLAPANGWWSHLFGDMIYGRIKVGVWSWKLGRWWHWNIGLGWETGGLSETGRRRSGGSALIVDPASKVCLGVSAALVGLHLYLLI